MELAIDEAKKGQKEGDYAIGAVLVKENKILAICNSRTKRNESSIAHAEILAIIKGSKILKSRHLKNCVLYTTHEPCPMCAGAIVMARLKGVVYGARYQDMKKYSNKNTNNHFLWRTIGIPCHEVFKKSTEKIELIKNFMRIDCLKLFHTGE